MGSSLNNPIELWHQAYIAWRFQPPGNIGLMP